jgi:PKHD-type hydroxylase
MNKNSYILEKNPVGCSRQHGLSSDEISKIFQYANSLPRLNGAISNEAGVTASRKSTVRWIYRNSETQWLYDKCMAICNSANQVLWQFDLAPVATEAIQYTEYHDNGGHYDYHLDLGESGVASQRKVSLTIQLSESNEYEGGDFKILRGDVPETFPRDPGSAIVFPSYLLHKVTPVTRGTRKSLVFWLGGNESYK